MKTINWQPFILDLERKGLKKNLYFVHLKDSDAYAEKGVFNRILIVVATPSNRYKYCVMCVEF